MKTVQIVTLFAIIASAMAFVPGSAPQGEFLAGEMEKKPYDIGIPPRRKTARGRELQVGVESRYRSGWEYLLCDCRQNVVGLNCW